MLRGSKLLVAAVAIAICLGGCSVTSGVQGASDDGHETFTGSATGYMDGSGVLQIHTSEGRTCTGNFVYINGRQGQGTFACSDGQGGPFSFVSTGTHGTGTGRLGGKPFSFTFG